MDHHPAPHIDATVGHARRRQELVAAGQALGRVCALPTVACPPAIPIAVSGEAIGPAAVELFRLYGVEQVAVTTE